MTLDDILQSPALASLGAIMLEQSKQKTQRKYAALNRLATRGGTVMVGDSIVEGFPLQEFFDEKIYNRGISGDTSSGMLRRLPETVLELKPKTAIFWIGTNDLQEELAPEEICSNVERAATLLERECSSEIIILSVAPVNNLSTDATIQSTVGIRKNEDIARLNELYRDMCEKKGRKYLDVFSLLAQNGSLPEAFSEDGLHPNIAGYIPVAKKIAEALSAL